MRGFSIAAVTLLFALVVTEGLVAQSSSAPQPSEDRRPYRGIFGSFPNARSNQSLVWSGSLFGAYDQNVLAGLRGSRRAGDWRHQRSGYYSGAVTGLRYGLRHSGQRWSTGVSAGSELQYYWQEGREAYGHSHSASLNASVTLTRSTRLSARHSLRYSPGYNFSLLPIDGVEFEDAESGIGPAIEGPDQELFRQGVLRMLSSVALTRTVGTHTRLSGGYSHRHARFFGADEEQDSLRDYSTSSVFARIMHDRPISRYATFQAGYGIRMSQRREGSGEPSYWHDIRAGINYSRPLSFSRRTSLQFSSGSAIVARDSLSEDTEATHRLRMTGSASLVHELGRSWTAHARFSRGVMFREGYDQLFFSDTAVAGIGGLVTRRISFAAGVATGWSHLDRPGANGHRGYSAFARSTYALNRYVGAFVNYVYYRHRFGDDVPLHPTIPQRMERNGIRVGVTSAVPLFSRSDR